RVVEESPVQVDAAGAARHHVGATRLSVARSESAMASIALRLEDLTGGREIGLGNEKVEIDHGPEGEVPVDVLDEGHALEHHHPDAGLVEGGGHGVELAAQVQVGARGELVGLTQTREDVC